MSIAVFSGTVRARWSYDVIVALRTASMFFSGMEHGRWGCRVSCGRDDGGHTGLKVPDCPVIEDRVRKTKVLWAHV